MYHKSIIESSVALGNQRFPRSRAFCKCTPCPVTESASKLAFVPSPWVALSKRFRGDNEIRTRDLLLARQALSQLSYTPICLMHISYLILTFNGLEWTRTIDLTLIRRAL